METPLVRRSASTVVSRRSPSLVRPSSAGRSWRPSAKSNLKNVTLELGERARTSSSTMRISTRPSTGQLMVSSESPRDILSAEINRAAPVSWNHGQCCCAGTRIFVQSGIYDKFLAKFTERSRRSRSVTPSAKDIHQGPQVSQIQFDVRSFPPPLLQRK
jgi:aldehyde dehydrogenase (NAD+)